MKTLDFNKPLVGPDRKPANDDPKNTLAHLLANVLSQLSKGDPIKLWGWAIRLTEKGTLELDDADIDTLKSLIKDHETMMVIGKAQLLEVIMQAQTTT